MYIPLGPAIPLPKATPIALRSTWPHEDLHEHRAAPLTTPKTGSNPNIH